MLQIAIACHLDVENAKGGSEKQEGTDGSRPAWPEGKNWLFHSYSGAEPHWKGKG